jgi:hypothetical protein
MLSDIAQEYGVEWDAHSAAAEMLPSGTPVGPPPVFPGGPPGPFGGPSSGAPRQPPGAGQGANPRFPGAAISCRSSCAPCALCKKQSQSCDFAPSCACVLVLSSVGTRA